MNVALHNLVPKDRNVMRKGRHESRATVRGVNKRIIINNCMLTPWSEYSSVSENALDIILLKNKKKKKKRKTSNRVFLYYYGEFDFVKVWCNSVVL